MIQLRAGQGTRPSASLCGQSSVTRGGQGVGGTVGTPGGRAHKWVKRGLTWGSWGLDCTLLSPHLWSEASKAAFFCCCFSLLLINS
jgi:hypothetical protein